MFFFCFHGICHILLRMRTNGWQLGLAIDSASYQSGFTKRNTQQKTPSSYKHYINTFQNFATKRQTSPHALDYPKATYVSKPPNAEAEKAVKKRTLKAKATHARIAAPEGKRKIKEGRSSEATREVYLKNTEDLARKQGLPKLPKGVPPIF